MMREFALPVFGSLVPVRPSAGILLLILAALTSPLAAHPYHATVAEAQLNAETGRLEISLKVIPEDLERALRRRHRERVILERTPRVDEMILDYLRDSFVVTQKGERHSLSWVGKEIGPEGCWLYFEVPMADGLAGAQLRNTIFFEIEASQINTVRLRAGDLHRTLIFTDQRPARLLAAEP